MIMISFFIVVMVFVLVFLLYLILKNWVGIVWRGLDFWCFFFIELIFLPNKLYKLSNFNRNAQYWQNIFIYITNFSVVSIIFVGISFRWFSDNYIFNSWPIILSIENVCRNYYSYCTSLNIYFGGSSLQRNVHKIVF